MAQAMPLIFACMTPSQKKKLDELAQKFHKHHRQSARKSFPQTEFTNGVTNLSNMTAKEECGLVFLLICLAEFEEGWKLLDDALVNKGQDTDLSKVLEALEALSCFDAWSWMDKYWKLSEQTKYAMEAMNSLAQMLTMIRDCLPHEKGNGWKLPTFHNTMRFQVRDAADPKTMATFYRTVVLYVLLYGSESWVLTGDLMRQVRSFHRRCCRGLTGEFVRQDEEGEWICPKSEEVLKKAGVLTIEEYIQRRRDTIMKYVETRNIYGTCKSSQKIASNLLWWEVNYYSNDAAEARTSQAPDG
jgi:hypothetical protein